MNRPGQMRRGDFVTPRQIRNRPRDFDASRATERRGENPEKVTEKLVLYKHSRL